MHDGISRETTKATTGVSRAPGVQVDAASHYRPSRYLSPRRMASIGWQLQLMAEHFPCGSNLEVGGGTGLARQLLTQEGFRVRTLDVDPALRPDVVGSVTQLPFADAAFDTILCCQVLEHVPWDASQLAMRELHRVCRTGGVISVPSVRRAAALVMIGPRRDGSRTVSGRNFGPAPLRHTREHYWELEAGVTERAFRDAIRATGFEIVRDLRPVTWMYHHFFVLRKAGAISAAPAPSAGGRA